MKLHTNKPDAGLIELGKQLQGLSGQARTKLLGTEAKKLGIKPAELEQRLADANKLGEAGSASMGTTIAGKGSNVSERNDKGTAVANILNPKIELSEEVAHLANYLNLGEPAPDKLADAKSNLTERFGFSSETLKKQYEIIPFDNGALYRRKGGLAWRPVPAEIPKGMDWDNPKKGYDPIHYIGLEVQKQVKLGALGQKTWAHPNNLDRKTLDAMVAKMVTAGPNGLQPVRQDPETGLPLNPNGPTGVSGRGESNLGPIHAQDMFVHTRNPETGEDYAILIKRKDTGQWAMPGGIVDPKDSEAKVPSAVATALREFEEETGAKPSQELVDHLAKAETVFHGVCKKDPRNTDHMWFETRVMAAEVPWEVVSSFIKEAKGSDDASDAKLVKLTDKVISELYADHPDFVRAAIDHLTKDILG